MVCGMQLALNEISLVLFTTLAPSGVVALILMGLPLLSGKAPEQMARRINQFMCIPLVVSMVGLVMSATHLGNPENVLYVFARVGVSPLSNEVAAAAVFLLLAGIYWLYSFARKPCVALQRSNKGSFPLSPYQFHSCRFFQNKHSIPIGIFQPWNRLLSLDIS